MQINKHTERVHIPVKIGGAINKELTDNLHSHRKDGCLDKLTLTMIQVY